MNESHTDRKRFLVEILRTGFIKILRALQTNNKFISCIINYVSCALLSRTVTEIFPFCVYNPINEVFFVAGKMFCGLLATQTGQIFIKTLRCTLTWTINKRAVITLYFKRIWCCKFSIRSSPQN